VVDPTAEHDAPTIPLGSSWPALEVEAAGEDRFTVVCPVGGAQSASSAACCSPTPSRRRCGRSVTNSRRTRCTSRSCGRSCQGDLRVSCGAPRRPVLRHPAGHDHDGWKGAVLATVSFTAPSPAMSTSWHGPLCPWPDRSGTRRRAACLRHPNLGASERRADGSYESTHRMWIRVDGELVLQWPSTRCCSATSRT